MTPAPPGLLCVAKKTRWHRKQPGLLCGRTAKYLTASGVPVCGFHEPENLKQRIERIWCPPKGKK